MTTITLTPVNPEVPPNGYVTDTDFGSTTFTANNATTALDLESRFSRFVTLEDFGGSTASANNAAAFVLAKAYCDTYGLFLDGRGLTYTVTTAVALPYKLRNMTINGPACVADVAPCTGVSEKLVAYVVGTDIWNASYPTQSPTAGITRGAQSFTVANASTYAAGQIVLLHEAANWGAGSTCFKSEVLTVKSVSSNTITFTSKIEGTYTTAATLRQYGNQTVVMKDVLVTGGGTGLDQTGLLICNVARVFLDDVEVRDCARRCGSVWNAAEVTAGVLRAGPSDRDGFGYGWQFSGSSNVTVAVVSGKQCRHVITGGGGASGKQLARRWQFGTVLGIGCYDAIWDCHPGVVDVQVGSVQGTCDPTYSSNEGFMFQGSRLYVGSISLTGFTDNVARIQYFGDGDSVEPSFHIGSLYAPNSGATLYGFTYEDDNATGGSWPVSTIQVDHIDTVTTRGNRIRAVAQTVRRVVFNGGRSEATNNAYEGLLVNSTTPGAITDVTLVGLTMTSVAGGTGQAFQAAGYSGQTINILASGCRFTGGNYGIAAGYATVAINRATFGGQTTGNTVTSTGGTIATATYT